MSYLRRLSSRQRVWLVCTLITMLAIVAVGWVMEPRGKNVAAPVVTTDMTIQQIAPQLGATGFAVAKELGLPPSADKKTALSELGVGDEQLAEVASHLHSHRGRAWKYYIFAALSLFGLVWLTRLGRPDGSPNSERRSWYPQAPYIATLVVAVLACGFALGKSPNPMEGAVKIFKGFVGLQPSMAAVIFGFVFFVGLAVVGNKLVCGWTCPFGALQELIYSLPILKRVKRKKLPFVVTNLVRGGLFVLMLLLLFGIVGGKKGFVVYHFMNPFNLFNWTFETPTILATVVLCAGLAFVTYRPFCQLICPFGFVSWLAERISLNRVRIDRNRCTQCGACSRACPLQSAEHIVAGKVFGADCYSCARCLRVCSEEALDYGFAFGKPSDPSEKTVVAIQEAHKAATVSD